MDKYIDLFDKYIQDTQEMYFGKFGEIENILYQLSECPIHEYQKLVDYSTRCPKWMEIHLLSFCMKVTGNRDYAIRLLDIILEASYDVVGEYNKLSHFWQMSTACFMDGRLNCAEIDVRLAKLYLELFKAFSSVYGLHQRNYIPYEERDKNKVFVFASQVLGELHAPTKTLLDRCYVLQKHMKKKVYIINTAMQMTGKGAAPFYDMKSAAYDETYLTKRTIQYKDEIFEVEQCENNMPDLNEIANIINKIRREKPAYIIQIGGSDLCADLCGMYVPEVTISTVFSKVAMSCGEYQIVDKVLTKEDAEILHQLEVNPSNVKRAQFTFSFKEQKHHFTKEQLGFSKNDFILLVVGWRLDEEVTADFLDMLEQTVRKNDAIKIAFMGKFEAYEGVLGSRQELAKRCRFLGAQEDALAVTECCDLYVNPKRNGGGSSVAEALYKGIPAVTLPMGDVSVAAGEEFFVNDYFEMSEVILRYAREHMYYEKMSEKAKKQAALLTNSEDAFCKVMKELEIEMERNAR